MSEGTPMGDPRSDLPPERFAAYSDDDMVPITLGYEGSQVPFFVILVWIGLIIGIVLYVGVLAVPDAVDWLG